MDGKLDELRVAGAPAPPATFDAIEQRVWARIESMRLARRAAPLTLAGRAAAVAGALALGMLGGGMTAVAMAGEAQEISAFSIKAELAPSTLLDHHG